MLENWLPLLSEFRRRHPDGTIVAFIPDRRTLAQIDSVDTIHQLFDEIVDQVIAPLSNGSWVAGNRFCDAPHFTAPRRLLKNVSTSAQRQARADFTRLRDSASILLYDLYLEGKPQLQELIGLFDGVARISQFHGGELRTELENPTSMRQSDHLRAALLSGPDEIPAYEHNFGLDESKLHVTGLLRQSPGWIEQVVQKSSTLHAIPFERFAFVVSRPAGSTYLPRERKVDALRSLYKVLWEEHGLPIVLRTHPKEGGDGTLEEALPPDQEGISWARSKAHPFHLGQSSEFAVTFLSGLSIDLVSLGVPTIEFLDVRGISQHDNASTQRDAEGRPVFGPYRRDRTVIPADDIGDLRRAVTHILSDRDKVAADLQDRLSQLFPRPTDLSELVTRLFD